MNESAPVRLDLNNPVFQRQLFALPKDGQRALLNTLRKLAEMSWQQVYARTLAEATHPPAPEAQAAE